METAGGCHTILAVVTCFNGATAFRRWKLTSMAQFHVLWMTCFNGATAFRRWKPGWPLGWGYRLAMETSDCSEFRSPASMGPPPFGDGNAFHSGPASMGPPPFGDGNAPETPGWWSVSVVLDAESKLQWGHRLSAMETGLLSMGDTVQCFNGATAFRRWKLESRMVTVGFNELQWGHRLSAMETRYGVHTERGPSQWGHRLSAIWQASMGPPLLSAMETALCGSSAPWIHAKALFSRRIGYRINGHSVRDQLGFAAP